MEKQKRKLCSQPKMLPQKFMEGISDMRLGFILSINKKWVNGTELTYFFVEGAEPQRKIVRQAFTDWKNLGIGLSFREVTTAGEAIVRIGFDYSDGSWSYVGRDILTIPKQKRTMNFGWDLTTDPYGLTTAIHEVGHTLGFHHAHQNGSSGIVWDKQAVYNEFSGHPNYWSKEMIDYNILNKIPPSEVFSSKWDPDSIMQYEFGPGLVLQPEAYRNGIYPPGVLSTTDIKGVTSFYPPIKATAITPLQLLVSEPIKAIAGEQSDYLFTAPTTRKYTFQIVGAMDAVMVVSEKLKNEQHYLAGDDDSGVNKNATITLPLAKERDYLIQIRVMFAENEKSGALIVY